MKQDQDQDNWVLPPLPESFVNASHSNFLYRVLLELWMNGILDRPYVNDLTEICQPGDRVRVVFFTQISDRNERVGEQVVLLDGVMRNLLKPVPELALSKAAKKQKRQTERKLRKKPPIQRFEGVVVASRWVRPLDILELDPLRDFQMVKAMRRLLPYYWAHLLPKNPTDLLSSDGYLSTRLLTSYFRADSPVYKQIITTVPHLPPRSQIVTVRKTLRGVSSEKTFCVNSPWVKSIERVYSSHVRRAKLYYLRGKTGKAARLKRRSNFVSGEV